MPIKIPITFFSELPLRQIAVGEAEFRKMMGCTTRSAKAARQASWRFRTRYELEPVHGFGTYLIEDIHAALKRRSEELRRRR